MPLRRSDVGVREVFLFFPARMDARPTAAAVLQLRLLDVYGDCNFYDDDLFVEKYNNIRNLRCNCCIERCYFGLLNVIDVNHLISDVSNLCEDGRIRMGIEVHKGIAQTLPGTSHSVAYESTATALQLKESSDVLTLSGDGILVGVAVRFLFNYCDRLTENTSSRSSGYITETDFVGANAIVAVIRKDQYGIMEYENRTHITACTMSLFIHTKSVFIDT
uniref:GatB_N domain-containing protein n=1 Tax=Heterorhabditis bacteriophora TaxID=37862 RepID=A0A1I7WIS0_HETBA